MNKKPKHQPHREGDHFISYRDSFEQLEQQTTGVQDLICQSLGDGKIVLPEAKILNMQLMSGELTPIDVMGRLLLLEAEN